MQGLSFAALCEFFAFFAVYLTWKKKHPQIPQNEAQKELTAKSAKTTQRYAKADWE